MADEQTLFDVLSADNSELREVPGFPGTYATRLGEIWTGWSDLRKGGLPAWKGGKGYIRHWMDGWCRRLHLYPHDGYLKIYLGHKSGKQIRIAVHRLVLFCLRGPMSTRDGMPPPERGRGRRPA
jgi:hypothetical protein